MARDDYTPNVADTAARVTEYYLNQALDRQNMVNTVMLNSTRQQYEKTVGRVGEELDRRLGRAQESLNAAAGGVILGSDDFQSAVRRCVSEMAEEGLTGFYDRSGREWSAQAYVTMDVRTTAANAAREAAMERNREYGNELIAVSSHPGARPLCEPYQGGVYSTDGSTGETTDLHGATISYYPLELTSYGEAAGLFGINCGHYPSPFIAGLSVVRKLDISREENERLYKESQQQRYMERKIRAQKTKADALAAAGDAAGAKAARMRAREMNKELKGWCQEKGRAYYPERVRVTRGEKAESSKEPTASSNSASALQADLDAMRNNSPLTKNVNHATIFTEERYRSSWDGSDAEAAFPIKHGFAAYPEGDPIIECVKTTEPIPGYFDVAMHGDEYHVGFGTQGMTDLTEQELAEFILGYEGYTGEDIRLLACSTGAYQYDDTLCFAERLATAMQKNVMAPSDDLYFKKDGTFDIGYFNDGYMRVIEPGERSAK